MYRPPPCIAVKVFGQNCAANDRALLAQLEVDLLASTSGPRVRLKSEVGDVLAVGQDERLTWHNDAGAEERVYIEVFTDEPTTCATYGLEVDHPFFCYADDAEPDDTLATATPLEQVSFWDTISEADDRTLEGLDVYTYPIAANSEVRFIVYEASTNTYGTQDPISLEVFRADGTLIGSADATGESVTAPWMSPQQLRIEVRRTSDTCLTYALRVEDAWL